MRGCRRVVALMILAVALPALAQAPEDGADRAKVNVRARAAAEAFEAAHQRSIAPGPNHKALEAYAGEWKLTVDLFTFDGKRDRTDTGTITAKMTMGGRFLQFDMEVPGGPRPRRAHGIIGYNPIAERYEFVSIDSVFTHVDVAFGTTDPATGATTYHHETPHPTGGQAMKFRQVVSPVKDDRYTIEYFVEDDGKEVRLSVNTLERAPGSAKPAAEQPEQQERR